MRIQARPNFTPAIFTYQSRICSPFQCSTPDAGTCVPKTCNDLGFNCGANGDGCGNIIQCGSCTSPQVCGGGGKPGVCGP